MSIRYLFIVFCLAAANAHAERIRDLSMPIGESLAQPDTNHSGSSIQPGTNMPYPSDKAPQETPDNHTTSNRFMDNYCNPNKRSAIADSPRMQNIQSCIDENKARVCAQFQQLPADAKVMLEAQVMCNMEAANNAGDSEKPRKDCSQFDSQRLDLLKKYEQDQQTTYTLLHLPDDVVYGSSRCVTGAPQ